MELRLDEARRRIQGRIVRTPLVEVPGRWLPEGARLFLKLEDRQRSGSFKARGAAHFIERLCDERTPAGVITYSSGNHGRAVAEAAAARRIPALVTVPDGIDASKARAIIDAGAELVLAGGTSESRRERAQSIAADRGWSLIPPFDHEWIIEGQSTVAAEIIEDLPGLSDLWSPVGGGGLAAGSAATLAAHAPEVRLHAVEPEGAAAYSASVRSGRRVRLDRAESVADGLLPLSIGERNWEWLRRVAARPVTVTEAQILASLRILRLELGVAAEPSGAVSAAPLLAGGARSEGSGSGAGEPGVHAAIVSGGNIAPERLERLLAEA